MESKYYLSINSTSLAHYFGSGCISPSKYIPNKPIDIQNKFDEYLLLSANKGIKGSDCCIEIALNKEEVNVLENLGEGFYLFNKPLPITRIKEILFVNKNQMEQTVTNIGISTAFIPENLIKVINNFDDTDPNLIEFNSISKNKNNNWDRQISKFNSLMGGFALMRLAGEDYMNYSENYFSTLSYFNMLIKDQVISAKANIDNRYFDVFVGENKYKKLYTYLNKVVDENDLLTIAKEENQNIIKDRVTKLIDLKNLQKATYIVAILNTYGIGDEGRRKKIDGLILSNFKSELKPDTSEVVALCYGLNKGYTVFPNKIKSDRNEKIIKFELNSQVDYYTIESLYQFAFNDLKSERFPYLDWCPRLKYKPLIIKKTNYQILDVIVVGKKKPSVLSPEYLSNLLQRFFQKENEGYFKDFIDKLRTIIYNDTWEEFNDEILIKDEQIKHLSKDREAMVKLELEVKRMIAEIDNYKLINKEIPDSLNEPKVNQGVIYQRQDALKVSETKDIVKRVLYYKNMKIAMLKDEAKERGISIPKGSKLEEIICLLMTKSQGVNESKIQFPE